jgi:hypothetical protein
MGYKDKTRQRAYMREWYQKHKRASAKAKYRSVSSAIEAFGSAPYQEFPGMQASDSEKNLEDYAFLDGLLRTAQPEEERYAYLDFLIDTETD